MNFTPEAQREKLGFKNGYITLIQGNTYIEREWLKESGAKFHKEFNWYFPSTVEVPAEFPEGLVPVRLALNEFLTDENAFIVFDDEFKRLIDSKRYPASSSEWVGTIGEKQDFVLKYVSNYNFLTRFGTTYIYTFVDTNDNVVKTMTSRVLDLTIGMWYQINAKVKDHSIYKNEKQTMVNYLRVNGEYFDDEVEK